ncbi:hypothetical protein DV532_26345 (plasmid) [Pseudomonas sp. Leaf58]|uniref:hypothetical protein n=1 Tax=Pseudomonas sp. Leaf58 TaxID=1736226 RepID=UPI0006F40205|nr:hypothetical protein [Pseudomonas sp. Leaf58]AYG47807.1 hypothetical protein DV532_26345 [Pseudomonas sp. Leaf58]KQN62626.1 hypothetical protein ASF02_10795 [Pseudomonas sp. Leaf58]
MNTDTVFKKRVSSMKLVAWALLAINLVSTAASAENIIRISAPIRATSGEGPEDAWVPADPLTSEWQFYALLNCDFTPTDNDLPLGEFTQTKTCSPLYTRTSQPREYNTVSHKYRNVGELATEERYDPRVVKPVSHGECRYDVSPGGRGNFWQTGAKTGGMVTWSWENKVYEIYDGYTSYMDSDGQWGRGRFMEMAADGITSLYAACSIEYEPWSG